MITFKNMSNLEPYLKFKDSYDLALSNNQKNIEAINISSFSKEKNEVDARMVNLKFVEKEKFIFFSNYQSPKSIQFSEHSQIAATIYWNSVNIQIRIKARIEKTSQSFNGSYFYSRDIKKNALAISSKQSAEVESFDIVRSKYQDVLNNSNLNTCPEYWGGYSFTPYSFEFWTGHKNRLNLRKLYLADGNAWKETLLEP